MTFLTPSVDEALTRLEQSIDHWAAESNRAATIISKLTAALKEIEEYAEDQYDGPEDKRMSRVLSICRGVRDASAATGL